MKNKKKRLRGGNEEEHKTEKRFSLRYSSSSPVCVHFGVFQPKHNERRERKSHRNALLPAQSGFGALCIFFLFQSQGCGVRQTPPTPVPIFVRSAVCDYLIFQPKTTKIRKAKPSLVYLLRWRGQSPSVRHKRMADSLTGYLGVK